MAKRRRRIFEWPDYAKVIYQQTIISETKLRIENFSATLRPHGLYDRSGIEHELEKRVAEQRASVEQLRGFFWNKPNFDLEKTKLMELEHKLFEVKQKNQAYRNEIIKFETQVKDVIRNLARRNAEQAIKERETREIEKRVREHDLKIRRAAKSSDLRKSQSFVKRYLLSGADPHKTGFINCFYCKNDVRIEDCHIEHKRPISRGGGNSPENVVLSCSACNLKKGTRTHAEFVKLADQADLLTNTSHEAKLETVPEFKETLRNTEPRRIGLCPCGSGLRFKKCCGNMSRTF